MTNKGTANFVGSGSGSTKDFYKTFHYEYVFTSREGERWKSMYKESLEKLSE